MSHMGHFAFPLLYIKLANRVSPVKAVRTAQAVATGKNISFYSVSGYLTAHF